MKYESRDGARVGTDVAETEQQQKVAADASARARRCRAQIPMLRLLMLTHFTPPPDNALLARILQRDVDKTPPRGLVLGEGGTLVVMPKGSAAIEVTRFDP